MDPKNRSRGLQQRMAFIHNIIFGDILIPHSVLFSRETWLAEKIDCIINQLLIPRSGAASKIFSAIGPTRIGLVFLSIIECGQLA